MLTPYEIIVKTALPAIRSMLAEKLTMKYNLKQKEIANLMHLTQAAVSYYLNKGRGKYTDYIRNDEEIKIMIENLADKIYREKISSEELAIELNKLILYIVKRKYVCDYHELLEPDSIEEGCTLCDSILKYWQT
jgi:hypothetical protein